MAALNDFITALEREVANHSIYVCGASGQLCKSVNEAWIRSKESRCQSGKYADMAVAEWRNVMNSQYKDVARCFDCSGYVSYCLMQAKALDKRRDCDGLYDRSTPIEKPENGCLLFRVNADNPNDETHVGVYYNGYQFHAKGRAYGVVKEKYNASYWAKMAWFKTLPHDEPEPQPTPDPTHKYVLVKGIIKKNGKPQKSVYVRSGNGTMYPSIGIAHSTDMFPSYGQADTAPHWYEIDYRGQRAYITCNERYTEEVYGI